MFIALAMTLVVQAAAPQDGWTWTLYEDDSAAVILAHEVPDTPRLASVLECERGSGVARLTLYGGAAAAGMARVSSGEAAAMAQAETSRDGALKLALPSDHPAFAAFTTGGRLDIAVAGQTRELRMDRTHLPKLRRFSELCSA